MEYHGYLDRFTLIGHCVIAEGWANEMDLALWYEGVILEASISRPLRPDLTKTFGEEAVNWGFSLCAALPMSAVESSAFRLRFNAGVTIDDPASKYSRVADVSFFDMTETFKNAVHAHRGTLLEIGSRARSGTTYRDWFPPDQVYLGLDVTDGPNVDIVGDAHHLSRYIDTKVDYIFSIAVFEHIIMPWKVALEMNRVMNQDGLALLISHGSWPLHEEPWDFFRFSKDAWRGLFNSHTGFTILDAQYQYEASVVPQYASGMNLQGMSLSPTYLLSGCLIRKTGPAQVDWNAEAGEIFNLHYSHA